MAKISVWIVLLVGLIPLLSGQIGEFRGNNSSYGQQILELKENKKISKNFHSCKLSLFKIAIIFLLINLNMCFYVLKRTVSLRRFF